MKKDSAGFEDLDDFWGDDDDENDAATASDARSRMNGRSSSFSATTKTIRGAATKTMETIEPGARSFQPMNINFGLFPPLATAPTKKPDGTAAADLHVAGPPFPWAPRR